MLDAAANIALQAKVEQVAETLADSYERLPEPDRRAFVSVIDEIKAMKQDKTITSFRLSASVVYMMADFSEYGFAMIGLIAHRRTLEKEGKL